MERRNHNIPFPTPSTSETSKGTNGNVSVSTCIYLVLSLHASLHLYHSAGINRLVSEILYRNTTSVSDDFSEFPVDVSFQCWKRNGIPNTSLNTNTLQITQSYIYIYVYIYIYTNVDIA